MSDEVLAVTAEAIMEGVAPGAKPPLRLHALAESALPILTVLAVLLLVWYAAAVWLNAPWARDQAQRAGTTVTFSQLDRRYA